MNRSIEFIQAHAPSRPRPTYRRTRDADVIPLRRRHGHPSAGPIVGFGLLTIAAWILLAAMLADLAHSQWDAFSQLAAGWPWW